MTGRQTAGSLIGATVAAGIAWVIRPLFDPPLGGVGFVTVNAYPKSWDYAVIALLCAGSAIGALLVRSHDETPASSGVQRGTLLTTIAVFVLMLFVHDHPYQHMDPFHEGEHL